MADDVFRMGVGEGREDNYRAEHNDQFCGYGELPFSGRIYGILNILSHKHLPCLTFVKCKQMLTIQIVMEG